MDCRLEIVPSSARSSSSAASPLPLQFVSLLGDILDQVKNTITRVMPMEKWLSALEEAEFEDVGGEEGALEKEMLMQCKCISSSHSCIGIDIYFV